MTKILIDLPFGNGSGPPAFLPSSGTGCVYSFKKGRAYRMVDLSKPGIVYEFVGGNGLDRPNFTSTFSSATEVAKIS